MTWGVTRVRATAGVCSMLPASCCLALLLALTLSWHRAILVESLCCGVTSSGSSSMRCGEIHEVQVCLNSHILGSCGGACSLAFSGCSTWGWQSISGCKDSCKKGSQCKETADRLV